VAGSTSTSPRTASTRCELHAAPAARGAAGTRWNYSTGETNLVGVLLGQATKKPLATYLSEKIWVPAGMEQQATWILNRSGTRSAAAASRPRARLSRASAVHPRRRPRQRRKHRPRRLARRGDERAHRHRPAGRGLRLPVVDVRRRQLRARGIFGQGIFIDPKRKIVIASNANWGGGASDRVANAAREAFYRAVQKAVDDEAASDAASASGRLSPSRRD
jgi:CubicO group peptidase (beta-lactamase class C family)